MEQLNEKKNSSECYVVQTAKNGERFLALQRSEEKKDFIIGSKYHPTHLAERYVLQFEGQQEDSVLILFGLGDGLVVRSIIEKQEQFSKIIVCEPSSNGFKQILNTFNLDDILSNPKVQIISMDENNSDIYNTLMDQISFAQRNRIVIRSLYQYAYYYPEQYTLLCDTLEAVKQYKDADIQNLVRFSKSSMENEILLMQYFPECYTVTDMKELLTEQSVCIMVAAGPSLEKNVEILKQAKNRAFILCVDTAARFLLQHNIIPDMIATFDPEKGTQYFDKLDISNIPLLISGDSDWHAVQAASPNKVFFASVQNDFYTQLFEEEEKTVLDVDGGGSVGTICFRIAVELGFQNIILVGQDLAFSDSKSHAGCHDDLEEAMFYRAEEVEGYYGGLVQTRADFKQYLDWYNAYIPTVKGCRIINATEGGAKIKGTLQMTLSDAVESCCQIDENWSDKLNLLQPIWREKEDKNRLLFELKHKYCFFLRFQTDIQALLVHLTQEIDELENHIIHIDKIEELERETSYIISQIQTESGMMILMRGMMKTELDLTDDMNQSETDARLEAIQLYKSYYGYFADMNDIIRKLLELWKEGLDRIQERCSLGV